MRSRKTVKGIVMKRTAPVAKLKVPDKCIDYFLDAALFLTILGGLSL
jgi:hypothetical protein